MPSPRSPPARRTSTTSTPRRGLARGRQAGRPGRARSRPVRSRCRRHRRGHGSSRPSSMASPSSRTPPSRAERTSAEAWTHDDVGSVPDVGVRADHDGAMLFLRTGTDPGDRKERTSERLRDLRSQRASRVPARRSRSAPRRERREAQLPKRIAKAVESLRMTFSDTADSVGSVLPKLEDYPYRG